MTSSETTSLWECSHRWSWTAVTHRGRCACAVTESQSGIKPLGVIMHIQCCKTRWRAGARKSSRDIGGNSRAPKGGAVVKLHTGLGAHLGSSLEPCRAAVHA